MTERLLGGEEEKDKILQDREQEREGERESLEKENESVGMGMSHLERESWN